MMGTEAGVRVAAGAGMPVPGTMLPPGTVRAVKRRETGLFAELKSSAQA